MTMKLMRVVGNLAPSRPEEVNSDTSDRMDTEIARHGLVMTLTDVNDPYDKAWREGVVVANNHSEAEGGGRPAAMDFITRLYNFVTAPGISKLGLQGGLTITVDGVAEPVVFKVTVTDNNVLYQEAVIAYEKQVPFTDKV